MPACRISVHIVVAAAHTAIFRHTLAGAGGGSYRCTLIEAMPQRVGVVGDEGAAAALAQMQGIAAVLTACRSSDGFKVVGLGVLNVGDVTVAADFALLEGVAGADTGSAHNRNAVLMLALRGDGLLTLAAVLADIQHLAAHLAGGVTNHNTLPSMTDGVHIVTLLNFPALHAEIAGIAEGLAGGVDRFKDNKVVLVPTAIVVAASVAVLVLAVTVRVSTTAGADRKSVV